MQNGQIAAFIDFNMHYTGKRGRYLDQYYKQNVRLQGLIC